MSEKKLKPTKMNPAVKKVWLKALRSGKYKQTTNRLRDPVSGGFCCLGVLCEVTNTEYRPSSAYLPQAGRKKSGVDPIIQSYLACMNDGDYSFSEERAFAKLALPALRGRKSKFTTIANVIEKYL